MLMVIGEIWSCVDDVLGAVLGAIHRVPRASCMRSDTYVFVSEPFPHVRPVRK